MTSVLQFNQQQAISGSSGGGDYVTESCVLAGCVTEGKWVNQPSGAGMLELSFESSAGKKANYLSICHRKKDGAANDMGIEQLQAMMGVMGIQNLSDQGGYCPEVKDKPVMLAMERRNYIKQSGPKAGEHGYKLEIKAFMSAKSRQTYAEHSEGKQPESCDYWTARFAQNPGGSAPEQQSAQKQQYAHDPRPQQQSGGQDDYSDFDSEIPF